MNWTEHTIWWHVYPLGFTGAPIREPFTSDPVSRLKTLLPWLDYAVELGCSGLALGPIFASESHGYDTVDYYRIDPRLGDENDFNILVKECKARGLHLLLDGVFNHVGRNHPRFQQALLEGPTGAYAKYFNISWKGDQPEAVGDFEGHQDLVTFNHAHPAVAEYVTDVLCHWLERGVSAWRLDAAYAVPPEFWQGVLPQVRRRYPQTWFVGEVIHGDYVDIVERSSMDSVTQYELWKAIWSGLGDKNFFELDWCLSRHNTLIDNYLPLTFIGNHDVTRISSQVGSEAAVLALVVLITVGGIPSIYYGDELGFTGIKEDKIGGDDAVRPAFVDRPDFVSPEGYHVYELYQKLLTLRRRYSWLPQARTKKVQLENTRYCYAAISPDGRERLDIELDLNDRPTARIMEGDKLLFSFPQ